MSFVYIFAYSDYVIYYLYTEVNDIQHESISVAVFACFSNLILIDDL